MHENYVILLKKFYIFKSFGCDFLKDFVKNVTFTFMLSIAAIQIYLMNFKEYHIV